MEATPEIIIIGWGTIKYVIDILKWFIPDSKKEYIPLLAVALGLLWTFFFFDWALPDVIAWWVSMWATAVGAHEVIKMSSKKKS